MGSIRELHNEDLNRGQYGVIGKKPQSTLGLFVRRGYSTTATTIVPKMVELVRRIPASLIALKRGFAAHHLWEWGVDPSYMRALYQATLLYVW